jgi:hypothetical protein
MKKIILILVLIVCKSSFAQTDSIVVIKTGPGIKRSLERSLIVNGFLISDTVSSPESWPFKIRDYTLT